MISIVYVIAACRFLCWSRPGSRLLLVMLTAMATPRQLSWLFINYWVPGQCRATPRDCHLVPTSWNANTNSQSVSQLVSQNWSLTTPCNWATVSRWLRDVSFGNMSKYLNMWEFWVTYIWLFSSTPSADTDHYEQTHHSNMILQCSTF